MRNKEAVLNLLHTGYAALRSTTTVDTSKPYLGKTVLEDGEESQLPIVLQRQEIQLIRVKNEEEIKHIANLKTARADQLERQLEVQQKLNFEELIQKDALQERIRFKHEADLQRKGDLQKSFRLEHEADMQRKDDLQKSIRMEHDAEMQRKDDLQKRLRVEREESMEYEQRVQQMAIDNDQKRNQMQLEMERAKLSLEHDRRMLDPIYQAVETERIAQLPVASVLSFELVGSESGSADSVDPPKPKKARNTRARVQVEISEAKKQANAEKYAKYAKTRRDRAEALKEKKRLDYLAVNATNTSAEAVKARYEDLRIRCGLPRG